MSSVYRFFQANMFAVFFLYGLVFFVMGMGILLRLRGRSTFKLARHLWVLGVFGVIHGFADWGYLFIPMHQGIIDTVNTEPLVVVQLLLSALSFAFLFYFGIRLITDTYHRYRWLRWIPWALFALWLLAIYRFYPISGSHSQFTSWHDTAGAWARYLLALTGGLSAAYGLFLQDRELQVSGFPRISFNLKASVVSMVYYSMTVGLMVPHAVFFPASVLNADQLFALTGVPVQVFRAFAGLALAFFMLQLLEIFDVESQRQARATQKLESIMAERERISREVHDGSVQVLYGLGLELENAYHVLSRDPEAARATLQRTMKHLDTAIVSLREYIMDLRPVGVTEHSLAERLHDLVDTYQTEVPSMHFILDFSGCRADEIVPSEVVHTMEQVTREALANTAKHSRARTVRIRVSRSPNECKLEIVDDGAGFRVHSPETDHNDGPSFSGHGLGNMEKRVELLGGQFQVCSREGKGTAIIATLPLWDNERRVVTNG